MPNAPLGDALGRIVPSVALNGADRTHCRSAAPGVAGTAAGAATVPVTSRAGSAATPTIASETARAARPP